MIYSVGSFVIAPPEDCVDFFKFLVCMLMEGFDFSIIFDGGTAVVRVIFEADNKRVVRIDCNGV